MLSGVLCYFMFSIRQFPTVPWILILCPVMEASLHMVMALKCATETHGLSADPQVQWGMRVAKLCFSFRVMVELCVHAFLMAWVISGRRTFCYIAVLLLVLSIVHLMALHRFLYKEHHGMLLVKCIARVGAAACILGYQSSATAVTVDVAGFLLFVFLVSVMCFGYAEVENLRLTPSGCLMFLILEASAVLKYVGIANALANMVLRGIDEGLHTTDTFAMSVLVMFRPKHFSLWIAVCACSIFLGCCWAHRMLVPTARPRPLNRCPSLPKQDPPMLFQAISELRFQAISEFAVKHVDDKEMSTNVTLSPTMIGNQLFDVAADDSINKDMPEMDKDKWSVPQCVICMENCRSEILSPCLHFVSCKTCVVRIAANSNVPVCPICRTAFKSIFSVRCKQPSTNAACSFVCAVLVADAICHVNKWTVEQP